MEHIRVEAKVIIDGFAETTITYEVPVRDDVIGAVAQLAEETGDGIHEAVIKYNRQRK